MKKKLELKKFKIAKINGNFIRGGAQSDDTNCLSPKACLPDEDDGCHCTFVPGGVPCMRPTP